MELYLVMNRIKWTYDMIKNEAIKYSTSGEFRKYNPKAYNAACRKKILSDFFENIQTYWSIDDIKKEASKYSTKNEFRKNSNKAYQSALRKNILDDLFVNTNYTNISSWNEELIKKESLKYKTKSEFKYNCPGAYHYALTHNMIDELYDNVYVYWTDENVIEFAKSCDTKKEFYQNGGAYGYARKHNLLHTFTWLIDKCDEIDRCVYVYKDEENKVAYVGLIANKEVRHNSHKTGMFRGFPTRSAVFDYFTSIGKNIPEPIYLESGLTLVESQYKEDYYKKLYESMGYRMLNIAKTGVGVGSTGYHKWSKKKLIEIASQYNTKTELYRENRGAYDYAINHNMIDELFDNVHNMWSEETVKSVASKCKNRYDFLKKYRGAYNYANRHDILNDLFGNVNHWNDSNVRECASKCLKRNDFHKKYPGAYKYAYRNNLLNDLFPNEIIVEKKFWNDEMVINESKKYKNRYGFKKGCISAYNYAKRHNMLNVLYPKK